MVVEGVLKSLVGDAPITEGVGLYKALSGLDHRLMLVTVHDRTELREWLRHQQLRGHIHFNRANPLDVEQHTLLRTLAEIRATGPVDLYIDADPGRCAAAFAHGYTVVPFLVPAFARPNWRPDWTGTPRPWQELDAEVRRQRELAADRRDEESEG